jgi:hypothetical protein
MKTSSFLCIVLIIVLTWGCKKEDRIRHELSGVWEVEKSETSYYSNGEVDSVLVSENLGRMNLFDDKNNAFEFNNCYLDFENGFWPLGFNDFNAYGTSAWSDQMTNWYPDLRARDRITFWASGGFGGGDPIFVIYTRIKNANGPGKREQWMYIDLDANGAISTKEVLYMKLVDASGTVVW